MSDSKLVLAVDHTHNTKVIPAGTPLAKLPVTIVGFLRENDLLVGVEAVEAKKKAGTEAAEAKKKAGTEAAEAKKKADAKKK